jgi:hypothetical protein
MCERLQSVAAVFMNNVYLVKSTKYRPISVL